MCTKTVSQIVNTVGVAIAITVISLATMELARAGEESCEYSIYDKDSRASRMPTCMNS